MVVYSLNSHAMVLGNRELAWFEDYLFGRRQFLTFKSVNSEWQTVLTGVPQGSVLGPLLFILLINDIDLQLQKCEILLYADDTVVFTSDKSCEIIESNLNSRLTNLAIWFSNNQLVLNHKKRENRTCIIWNEQETK